MHDVSELPGWSKFDYLAISIARRLRGVCFGQASHDAIAVVQCGDGRILAPEGFSRWRYAVICHDSSPIYSSVTDGAVAVFRIGHQASGAICFESFPLDECDMHMLPKSNILVVGGRKPVSIDISRELRTVSFNTAMGERPFNRSRHMLSFYYRSASAIVHMGDGNGSGYLGALAAYHCRDVEWPNGSGPTSVTPMSEFIRAIGSIR